MESEEELAGKGTGDGTALVAGRVAAELRGSAAGDVAVGMDRGRAGSERGVDADRGVLRRLLPPLVLGAMLNPLNSTMLSTALTKLTHAFDRDVSAGALLITPLYLTAMIGQPLMGRLADLYSPKRVTYLGLWLVLAAVLVGVFAPSFGWLILSRVLLGLGSSANYPSAIAILRRHYAQRGLVMPSNALGWISMGGMVSMVLGPMVGGFLTDWWGWQGIFLINIPLVLLVAWLSRRLPEEGPSKAEGTSGGTAGLGKTEKEKASAGGKMEKERGGAGQAGHGFAVVRLFKARPIVALIYIQSTAAGLILYLTLYGLPQWLEGVQGFSPSKTGLILLPMSLTAAVSSLAVSRRAGPLLTKWLAVTSAAVGSLSLFALHAGSPLVVVIGVSILIGLITGFNPIANQVSLNETVPPDLSGFSFGLYRTFVYVGAVCSGGLLKYSFHKGVTDAGFGEICWFTLYSALIMTVLYLPVLFGRRAGRWGAGEKAETAS